MAEADSTCVSARTDCHACPGAPALQLSSHRARVQGISYACGVVPLYVRSKVCLQCKRIFRGCWALVPGADEEIPELACEPKASSWFLFRVRLRENALVALHVDYLAFMTSGLLHLRASFSGFAKVLADMFPGNVLDSQGETRAGAQLDGL